MAGRVLNENDDRFRLFCCHVTTWAWCIAIVQLISLLISTAAAIGNFVSVSDFYYQGTVYYMLAQSGLVGATVGLVLGLLVIGLLIYGLTKEKAKLLIAYMILQLVTIVVMLGAAISYFVLASLSAKNEYDYDPYYNRYYQRYGRQWGDSQVQAIIAVLGVMLLVAAVVNGFFLFVIYGAYRYLNEKSRAGNTPGARSKAQT